MLRGFRALLIIALVLPGFALQTGGKGATKKAAASAPAGMTLEDVITLTAAGIPDDVVIAKLRKENKSFDLSTEDVLKLKKANVSSAVMRVMMDPQAVVNAPPAPQSAPAVQPVVISPAGLPVMPGISRGGTSGATPAPGTEAKGDPNDPNTPHDSGIYLMTKDREGKPNMVVLERASYQGAKSGGYMKSAITYGIMKAKTKAIIPGPHASIRVADTSPVFYFYFEDKQAALGKTYFGVGNLSNPNQFSLLKLQVNKENRESTVGEFSALGSSSGADAKAMVPFKSERIRPGLYKVTIEDLRSGEYCFVASSNMGVATPYGATANMATDIFDFGVEIN